MTRVSLKIVGASGQGIDSMGEIVAKALKRSGYCVFGYREYPSLIKGGHASYQLDISNEKIESTETKVNVVVALNHHGLEFNIPDLKPGGIFIHWIKDWKFSKEHEEMIDRLSLRMIELPIDDILKKLNGKPILMNVILTSFLWAVLGQKKEVMSDMVTKRFAKKKDLLEQNKRCIEEGFALKKAHPEVSVAMPPPNTAWKDHLLITGGKAMGLGAIRAGVRLYAGYPMTPSSPLLTYIASVQNHTGMVVKQAEDEITAAQMVSGAMFMGTRALTATSGGGFDLMSETISLNGILENPAVFVLAQRPGPATGLPTWTAQGDLLLAINTAHGEFSRCVMAVSDAEDSYSLMNDAFNLAEEYQSVVIVMTDKQITEALYTQAAYTEESPIIRRGILVTDKANLRKLKASDRYDPSAKTGVSARWLPGSPAATYVAQGDEHGPDGTVLETAQNTKEQFDKRMRKMDALKAALPEPTLYRVESGKPNSGFGLRRDEWKVKSNEYKPDVLLIGWGSTKSVILDILKELSIINYQLSIAYLHFTYLWPLKTERFEKLAKAAKKIILVEGNYQGQLGMLLRQQTGMEITDKILKYDGRPFFYDELLESIRKLIS